MAKNEVIKEKTKATGEMVTKAIIGKVPTFSKAQLVTSHKYIHRRDALNALLKNDEQYSYSQVEEILKQFDKGVKE